MTVSLRTLLAHPSEILHESSDRESLLTPGLVVFALGVVMALQSVPMMAVAFAGETAHSLRLATNTGVVAVASAAPFNLAFNAGVAFVTWFALAAITYAGARLAGGTGTFRHTFTTVAWCAVPWILVYAAIVVIATAIAATSDASLASVLGGHALEFVPGRPPAYFDGSGLLDLRAWLFVAGVGLSARIWAQAVPSAHGDDLARGAAVVAAVVAVLAGTAILF